MLKNIKILISPVAQWKRTRLLIWGFWVRVPAGLSFLLNKDLQAKKSDNKGIRLIKKYVFKLYKLRKETLKETSSEED